MFFLWIYGSIQNAVPLGDSVVTETETNVILDQMQISNTSLFLSLME